MTKELLSDLHPFDSDVLLYGIGVSRNGTHVPLEQVFIMPAPKEMPLYTCHKKVRALEIRSIGSYAPDADGKLKREILFADPAFAPIWVDGALFTRYVPMPGDYYVVYEGDGYASFSPRKAFLDGYTLDGQTFADIKKELKS